MRHTCLFLLALLCSTAYADEWLTVDQSHFNMVYQLPASWEIDGFGSGDDWEDYGSSVCHCAGTINNSEDRQIWMVAYPMLAENIASPKRQKVWNYELIPFLPTDTISTTYFHWERVISQWSADDWKQPQLQGHEVWQLTAEKGPYAFILYFWGDPDILADRKDLILKIVHSFRPGK